MFLCCSAVVVGSSVIFFAGGALNSSQLTIAEIISNKDHPEDAVLNLRTPRLLRQFERPIPRLSSTMVSFGRYLVVFGGFNNARHQLNDFLVLYFLDIFFLKHILVICISYILNVTL